jgi:3-oxoacyl-[acyl-carrier-protein] synthase II
MLLGNTAAGIVGMETGAKGPNFAVQTACATATHALGEVFFFYQFTRPLFSYLSIRHYD